MPAPKRDLRAQVGQLLIMGFDGVEPSSKLRTTLETLQPGGVILFARNIREPRQTWDLLHECQQCVEQPMFLCVDMEGGTVDRLRDVVAPAPSVADVMSAPPSPAQRAKVGNLFREHGRVIGCEVRALGFNTDFAPVVDLGFEASRSVLTTRTASADPKQTVAYAHEFLRGLRDAHVLGCGKHFPGLGEANLDTHRELPAINKPWKRLWEEDLFPYRALHRQMPFIMVAHAAYPQVTKDRTPASLSRKWISDILRRKIGYRGLIVSDDLEMGGVLAAADIGKAAVSTLKAEADIFLVCHSEHAVWEAYHAVLAEAERDRRFARRIAEAAKRVRALKSKSREVKHHVPAPDERVVEKLRRQVWELGEEVRLARVAAGEQT
ncbi:MAG: beta-N-acetylhexosaminidase [Terriglobales bacterium]